MANCTYFSLDNLKMYQTASIIYIHINCTFVFIYLNIDHLIFFSEIDNYLANIRSGCYSIKCSELNETKYLLVS